MAYNRINKKKLIVMKNCPFCKMKTLPNYKEVETLDKYLTERAKIIPRSRNGLCATHQRSLTHEIKRARFMALLPFIVRV